MLVEQYVSDRLYGGILGNDPVYIETIRICKFTCSTRFTGVSNQWNGLTIDWNVEWEAGWTLKLV